MSEAETTEKEDPIEKLAGSINEQVSKDIKTSLASHLETINSKIDSLAPKKEDSEDTVVDDNDDDDDTILTRGDLKTYTDRLLKRVDEIATKASQTVNDKKSAKAEKDTKALSDFPQLNVHSAHYNSSFEAEVVVEMKARVSEGKDQQDPNLVYDAAAVVKALNPKYHLSESATLAQQQRQFNNSQSHIPAGTKAKTHTGKANETQMKLIKSLGMSKEKVEDIWKRHGKNY